MNSNETAGAEAGGGGVSRTAAETTLAYEAAWKLSQGLPAVREISMAKARASDASRKVCLLGVKIHGGVGISEEHDVQIYFRRAKAAEVSFGDGLYHREIIARDMGL